MICYPADVSDDEVSALNDYWRECSYSEVGFHYKMYVVKERYEKTNARSIHYLVTRSTYLPRDRLEAFTCEDCGVGCPATNRKDFELRKKAGELVKCADCHAFAQQQIATESRRILDEFRAENFQPYPYLDDMGFIESLAMLTLLSAHENDDHFLGDSANAVTVTGVPSVDHKLLQALVSSKALIHLVELPEQVVRANDVIYGDDYQLTYDDSHRQPSAYRNLSSISAGVYLNALYGDQPLNIPFIISRLYENVACGAVSLGDVERLRQLVIASQVKKLYGLVLDISKEYRLRIENSPILQSLLGHLASNYPPNKLLFTFHIKARDTITYIHKHSIYPEAAKNCFSKFVGSYIQYIEDKGYELSRTWNTPASMSVEPLEAIFSKIFLDDHFNWDGLSAKDVVALWLNKVQIDDESKRLAQDDKIRNSTDK